MEPELLSTRRRDRITRPAWYAQGKTDVSWRIEHDQTIHVRTGPTAGGLWNATRVIRPGQRLDVTDPLR